MHCQDHHGSEIGLVDPQLCDSVVGCFISMGSACDSGIITGVSTDEELLLWLQGDEGTLTLIGYSDSICDIFASVIGS